MSKWKYYNCPQCGAILERRCWAPLGEKRVRFLFCRECRVRYTTKDMVLNKEFTRMLMAEAVKPAAMGQMRAETIWSVRRATGRPELSGA